jgi:hypothetical protein
LLSQQCHFVIVCGLHEHLCESFSISNSFIFGHIGWHLVWNPRLVFPYKSGFMPGIHPVFFDGPLLFVIHSDGSLHWNRSWNNDCRFRLFLVSLILNSRIYISFTVYYGSTAIDWCFSMDQSWLFLPSMIH